MIRAAALALALIALAAPSTAQPTLGSVAGAETKDRMSADERATLVADATKLIDDGLEAAQAKIEHQLVLARNHGKATLASADLLSAFGVEFWRRKNRELSAEYLERAVHEYEEALGPSHPEVALALNDYADVLRRGISDPPLLADEALSRALRIRQVSLGPDDGETLMNALYLSEVEGLPSRTHGEAVKVDAAIARIRAAFQRSGASKNITLRDRSAMLFQIARIYVLNRRIAEAEVAYRRLADFHKENPDAPAAIEDAAFESLLEGEGYHQEAAAIFRH